MAPNKSRWDDEYDSYQDDQNAPQTIVSATASDDLWYQDARYDG